MLPRRPCGVAEKGGNLGSFRGPCVGDLRSFDAFLSKYNLTDPALRRLAEIVRGADTLLKHGMVMYDALNAWCRGCQGEAHNWPPKMQRPAPIRSIPFCLTTYPCGVGAFCVP